MMPKCPRCGAKETLGQIDLIPARADIGEIGKHGEIEFCNESDVDWDGQRSRKVPAEYACTACGATDIGFHEIYPRPTWRYILNPPDMREEPKLAAREKELAEVLFGIAVDLDYEPKMSAAQRRHAAEDLRATVEWAQAALARLEPYLPVDKPRGKG